MIIFHQIRNMNIFKKFLMLFQCGHIFLKMDSLFSKLFNHDNVKQIPFEIHTKYLDIFRII